MLATEARGPEGSNDRVSADSDEEFSVLLASDGEEDHERSEQRLGSSHTHTHTLTHTPIPPKNNICPPSLTPFPRIIAFTADASTKGEAGCRPAASVQSDAALNMGVALILDVRACRGPSAGADKAPGPPSHSSASACVDDRVREAAKWLQAVFDGGRPFAKLHLAHLTFYAGQEDAALAHLKEHLSWRVQRGRDTCAGGGQTRGEDTPMLTCSGCRVSRFPAQITKGWLRKKPHRAGVWRQGCTRTSAECSASGLRLSKTVWRLTRALQTWWCFFSDECAMPDDSRMRVSGGDCRPFVPTLASTCSLAYFW